jgi:hypothetical protein
MAKKKEKPKAKRPCGAPLLYTPQVLEKLADDLEKWSQKDTSHFLEGFIAQCGLNLTNSDMQEFSGKNQKFKETLLRVKYRLIDRIKSKGCSKVFDGNFVSKLLPLIDLEYRKWRQTELQIGQENAENAFRLLIHPDRMKKAAKVAHESKQK